GGGGGGVRRNVAAGRGVALAAGLVGDLLLARLEDRREVLERRLARDPVRRARGDLRVPLQGGGNEPGDRREHVHEEHRRGGEEENAPAEAAAPTHSLRPSVRISQKASSNVTSAVRKARAEPVPKETLRKVSTYTCQARTCEASAGPPSVRMKKRSK